MLDAAPLFEDIAQGPPDGAAYWLRTSDDLQIRIAVWGPVYAKATVLLFPGRTEYIEKYGQTAADLAANGFATVVIDWRGQGLADRILSDRHIGHVGAFTDYQTDIAAVMEAVDTLNLPNPRHLIAQSLGGSIGLRAMMDGLNVKSAAFSAPMWDIALSPLKRSVGRFVSSLSARFGRGGILAPSTTSKPYVLASPFEDNMLTTDPQMFDLMGSQLKAYPDLSLGGPSMAWLSMAMLECETLAMRPCPNVPALTFLGTNERIVSKDAITDRMARWSNGKLHVIDAAEHEVLMETPDVRRDVIAKTCAHFDAHN